MFLPQKDGTSCFECKQTGDIASQCPNRNEIDPTSSSNTSPPKENTPTETNKATPQSSMDTNTSNHETEPVNSEPHQNK
ncbi:unnamed protein product [Ceutorhynchus assimilis]|uniref:CCHC-type domain-containing protein n=1 Tax=Ceutorhynchus assimilis TaxID=467358 RepID=A0A9N9MPX4_9CUCU|nr:unnamed protein product [Ceutorhynchus assimilis]